MNFNKKILIIACSFSFCNGIICMNDPKTESEKQAFHVAESIQTYADVRNLKSIEVWLTKERQTMSEKAWPGFVRQFVSDIEKRIPFCQSPLDEKNLTKVKDVIKDEALNLESGNKCTLLIRVLMVLEGAKL
jgi:hypothetical protein